MNRSTSQEPQYEFPPHKGASVRETKEECWELVHRIAANLSRKCGFGVNHDLIGTDKCAGCHFLTATNECTWHPEKGVNPVDGPTGHPDPFPKEAGP